MTATDSIAELRGAVDQAAPGPARRRAHRAGALARPPAEAGAGRLQLQRGDAAGRRRWATTRAPSPSACGRSWSASLGESGSLERIEVAGPGFVNLFLSDAWYRRALAALVAAGEALGPAPTASPERVLVEFVSANPTGPLHVGGGRHAAYGDALVRLLEAVGHEAEREYYVNDAGGQITRFADSIAARMAGDEPPEGGYEGEYVAELGARIAAEGIDPADREAVGRRGIELMLEEVRGTLERFGVQLRHLVLRARPLRSAARSSPRSPSSTRAATPTATRTRSGCARPPSATTRTGS